MTATRPAGEIRQAERRRRPRGAVRAGLVAAGLELARTGGPDAVVLREATRMVGVVPNAAYRHFADRNELLAAVWSTVHGLAVLAGSGPLRDVPDATLHRLEELTFAFIGESLAASPQALRHGCPIQVAGTT